MQTVVLLQYLGWILLFIGILLVCISVISATRDSEDNETRIQSKGIIFLGPIPIVWGYGKKGWLIAGVIGIILFLIWIVVFIQALNTNSVNERAIVGTQNLRLPAINTSISEIACIT